MNTQTRQLSTVLDQLLQQESEGQRQDSTSLNTLLSTVLPAYSKRNLTVPEQDVVIKIFKAIRLLILRCPSLILDCYVKLIDSIQGFYNLKFNYSKKLINYVNLSFISVIVGCLGYGSKLRNNRYCLKIKKRIVEIINDNLIFLLNFITSTKNNEKDELLDLDQIYKQNEIKFEKLCVSTTFLQILLDNELYNAWNLDLQESIMIDEFILRLWFCLDNIVINFKLVDQGKEEEEEEDDDDDDDEYVSSQVIHTIKDVSNITEKFDKLYSTLLASVIDFTLRSGELNHFNLVLRKCKELLNWSLLPKFNQLQVTLGLTLMKLLYSCFKNDTMCMFWSQLGITSDRSINFAESLFENSIIHYDLKIVINLLLFVNLKLCRSNDSILVEFNEIAKANFINGVMLDEYRSKILSAFFENDKVSSVLKLTDFKNLISFIDPSIKEPEKQLHTWINDLRKKVEDPNCHLLDTDIGKIYLVDSIGRFACMISGDFNFETKFCCRCDLVTMNIIDTVDVSRKQLSHCRLMATAFDILLDVINDKTTLNNEHLLIRILISLGRIFKSFRSPNLKTTGASIWKLLSYCFVNVVREIRVLTVKILPLIILGPKDDQYSSDLDVMLKFVKSFKPANKTSYLFEGIIMSYGELIPVTYLDSTRYIMLDHLIQLMGDQDQFRSNLALHELKLVSKAMKVTPWKLVESFIPLISSQLVQEYKTSPGLLDNVCALIGMSVAQFLERTAEYTVSGLVQTLSGNGLTWMATTIGKDKVKLIDRHIVSIISRLLTCEDEINPDKIVKLLAFHSQKYKSVDLATIIDESGVFGIVWETLCLYNGTEEAMKKIKNAIVFACKSRYVENPEIEIENEQVFIDDEISIMILGVAQSFSGIIHDHKGSKPFSVKIQAIRAISCVVKLTDSFKACLSQIMTCLQIALDLRELQYESLKCLEVIVLQTEYDHLRIIMDLLLSYLILNYENLGHECKVLAKEILTFVIKKDKKIFSDYASYVYSIAVNSSLKDIVAGTPRTSDIIEGLSNGLLSDNKWVVLQALNDCIKYFNVKEVEVQKRWLKDAKYNNMFSKLLSSLLDASNKFSTANLEISTGCAKVISIIGALDMTKFDLFFNKKINKRIVLISNMEKDSEVAKFSAYFLNEVLVKSFVASIDPRKQLFLAYAIQEYLKILELTPSKIELKNSSEYKFWNKLNKLSQTVLRPLLVSKYSKNYTDVKKMNYPIYSNSKKHATWIREFTSDLVNRVSKLKKVPKTAKNIFNDISVIIKDQDLSISEFILPYVALLAIVHGDGLLTSDIEIEFNKILNEDLDKLSNESVIESLKACYQTVFSVIDYFREWSSERKRVHDQNSKDKTNLFPVEEHNQVENFLDSLPTAILAIRTAQCNSYERAIFNLEQSYLSGKLGQDKFSSHIRSMYSEIDDLDSLHGVLKAFSNDSLNDKLLQFRYSEDWQVTHECLSALTELEENVEEENHNEKKLDSITSFLKCLDDHCEYDQVLLKLKNFEGNHLGGFHPSKDWVICALQASIFSGKLEELNKWIRYSQNFHSISSLGSDLSIYYEFARGLITLHENKLELCEKHIERAIKSIGFALSLPREISHIKISNYTVLLHCLYDFQSLAGVETETFVPVLESIKTRSSNTIKDYKINWKIHSLRKSIEKLHPLKKVNDHLSDTLVESSEILRESGRLDLASKNITIALTLGNSSKSADLEYSKLLWAQGEHSQALKLLKSLLDSGLPDSKLHSIVQLTYISWLEESAGGSFDEIKEGYEQILGHGSDMLTGEAHYCLGKYYGKMLDAQSVESPGLTRSEKDYYGDIEAKVIRSYIRSAVHSEEHLFEVLPKAVTVWLDYKSKYRSESDFKGTNNYSFETILIQRNQNYSGLLKFISAIIRNMANYKWYCVLSQLVSRITHRDKDTLKLIIDIIVGLGKDYPEVILYSIYSQQQSTSTERVTRGNQILDKLKNSESIASDVNSSLNLLKALSKLCEFNLPRNKKARVDLYADLKFSYPSDTPCSSLALPISHNFDALRQSNLNAHVKSNYKKFKSEKFITYLSFDKKVNILSSMQRPKRVFIRGSDGNRYSILCKKDDLRKDAKVLEFTTVVNRLLHKNLESEKRNLSITTYAAIPLNETIGVIEWVDNSRTLRDILLAYYRRSKIEIDFGRVRASIEGTKGEEQYKGFLKLKEYYRPVLPAWFIDEFANPVNWFACRNNFVRSSAVMSFVGYLVGMGDRHGDNIMLSEKTGGVMHVDFDCLFDKGKSLAVPEIVPFRLTHNMVAAMGVTGIEGIFRRTSEVTMKLIRNNENILMNVLETFLYDPIMDWKRIKTRHGNSDSDADMRPQVVMDSIRRKIKGILDPKDLDTGCKNSGGLAVSIGFQVDAAIQQATDDHNLAKMYIGWMPFV